eukprot:TRINITY_DN10648_c0_g1_i5.p1 TRINITY_DN10648_c0_g1~~TRINITY_DN10648_c0_g1_i5.p1  ORF type:complete len:201 (-),score=33.31 TRINITY_DN10648_c0_g1_i5:373-975(-)
MCIRDRYRAVPNFLVQFGLNASSSQRWGPISDDSKAHSPNHFARGMVSFAGSGPNSRDTEMFIAFAAVSSLGQAPWETPFGVVTRDTLHVLDQVNTEYGDMPPWGTGPNPSKIRSSPDYLANSYPNIDYWQECHVLDGPRPPAQDTMDTPPVRITSDSGGWAELAEPGRPMWMKFGLVVLVVTPALIWGRYSWLKKTRKL